MRGLGLRVLPVVAGFRTDAEKLLAKYHEKETIRFDKFADCFREMKFAHIYSLRQMEVELKEFETRSLVIALTYCFPPNSVEQQDRAGGVYLLYSLFYVQPHEYRVLIRITLEQLQQLFDFAEELKEDGHFDTLYCVYKLVVDNAFQICAFSEEKNPLAFKRFDNVEDTDKVATFSAGDLFNELDAVLEDPTASQIEVIHQSYKSLKLQLYGSEEMIPSQMSFCNDSLLAQLKKLVQSCSERESQGAFDGLTAKGKRAAKDGSSSPVKERRSNLKQKAFSQLSRQSRHRRHRQQQLQHKQQSNEADEEQQHAEEQDQVEAVVSTIKAEELVEPPKKEKKQKKETAKVTAKGDEESATTSADAQPQLLDEGGGRVKEKAQLVAKTKKNSRKFPKIDVAPAPEAGAGAQRKSKPAKPQAPPKKKGARRPAEKPPPKPLGRPRMAQSRQSAENMPSTAEVRTPTGHGGTRRRTGRRTASLTSPENRLLTPLIKSPGGAGAKNDTILEMTDRVFEKLLQSAVVASSIPDDDADEKKVTKRKSNRKRKARVS